MPATTNATKSIDNAKPKPAGRVLGATFPAIVATLTVTATVWAGVPIYGGPTYDKTTRTGFLHWLLPSIAGNGVGVGTATKYTDGRNRGRRAVRWDAASTTATELGILGTGTFAENSEFYSYDANAGGTAVGVAQVWNGEFYLGFRAVRWDAGGTAATELGNLGTSSRGEAACYAYAINDAGTVVGKAYKYSGGTGDRAVRWDAGGTTATELDHIGTDDSGFTSAVAHAINARGTAVGSAGKYSGGTALGQRAVRWNAGGTTATELDHIGTNSSGYTSAVALAINAGGTVVGIAHKYTGDTGLGSRAVRWNAGGTIATELGNLGTDNSGATSSRAVAVNAGATAVGNADKYAGGTFLGFRAVRWDAGGTTATELRNLGTNNSGITYSDAYAINDASIAVGFANTYTDGTSRDSRAVYWGLDGAAIDLNTLLSPADALNWTLTYAHSISSTGWVTGIGRFDPDGASGPLETYDRLFLIRIPGSSPDCVADVDDGSGTGTPDGGVTIDDLLYYLDGYSQGLPRSDIDDGSSTGTPDGGVTIDDLLYYLLRFENGC